MEPTVTAMDNIITNVGKVVSAGMDWMGEAVTTITSSGNELLLLFTTIGLIGTGIGLLRRLIG